MPRSRAETLAYARGYAAGSCHRWPEHKPPLPPDELLAPVISAASALRDGLDGLLATFDESDTLQDELGPLVDRFDAVMQAWTAWLTSSQLVNEG